MCPHSDDYSMMHTEVGMKSAFNEAFFPFAEDKYLASSFSGFKLISFIFLKKLFICLKNMMLYNMVSLTTFCLVYSRAVDSSSKLELFNAREV